MTIYPDQLSYLRHSFAETSLLEVMVENMIEPVAVVDSDLILKAYNRAFLSDLSIPEPASELPIRRLMPTLDEHIDRHGHAWPHLPETFTLLHTPQPGQGAVHIQVKALSFGGKDQEHCGYVLLMKEPPASDQLYEQIRQLEQIIDQLRAQFVHLGSTELDRGIDTMLSQLGNFFQVDRSYLFQESLSHPGHLDNTHEWCAEGIEPQRDNLQMIPMDDDLAWVSQWLREGKIVNYTDIHDLPPEGDSLRQVLAVQDIQSVLMVPFRFEDGRIGFMGFDAVRQTRVWTREVERLLRVLGEVIGPALQRQRAGLELERINQRYRNIVNLITDFIFYLKLDHEGNIQIEWAHGNVEAFGDLMPTEATPQAELFEVVYPDDLPVVMAGIETLMRGEVLHARIRLRWVDGSLRWIESISNPVLDEHGRLAGILSSVRDITDLRLAEERTQNLANTLMQRNAELQQFAYITSHNLRAPVMNLVSLMGFYDRECPEAKTNEGIIEKVDRSVHRLHETLNDLLEIVDIKDPEEASRSWERVDEALEYVRQSIGEQLLRVKAVVHTDFQVEEVYFSGPYLRSVLLNLLANAIKYRSPDRPLRIWIHTERVDGATTLSVRDNGIGIDLEKNRHRLFRMYQRLQEQGEGRGLGLYMVRSQVEAMGGKVHVESALNVGTTFYLYLPDPEANEGQG